MSRTRLRGESVVSPNDKERWSFHEPVLVEEVVDLLLRGGEGLFLDGTVGGGGHARALLERCSPCRLVGVDRDADAVARAKSVLAAYGDRIRLLRCRFDEAPERAGIAEGELAGALLDLGVSSHQIDRERRGFTFAPDAPLDMRMGGGEEDRPSAADLLNEADEERLVRIFRDWGEEPRARRLAREVVRRRESRAFRTSDDLVGALDATLGR
ncbi:MAG: 16S rRNA (cytosine(1402)-N(4))-methyltransferase RsmH, partial [Gemmatimonadetes bacterium]|nr:16S rRNA (cytosine(1402)-N(4))-methyltransferase RsmH [Gemmatimonadota bacterium]NIR78051.1 16S rRNA (cytosine(1402)-N(4))-methyltransferase RsmH [Gemmatimonadota bacterium]NIT86612.1 16S rRNA (cytosine(1402)-N(4))-methyltransferase RsmH [Gemmatimonadota bacterium]NIU30457.1 16S rRNA (cytosine(1402)-N(4))-methyltransferase RsmH [Gemmatimonadota bacterium]NIU35318.1 16S rRNA (cytosine(1402)-N(4))-methyltransferase RsmH [Gemmatimonadota bacterium]